MFFGSLLHGPPGKTRSAPAFHLAKQKMPIYKADIWYFEYHLLMDWKAALSSFLCESIIPKTRSRSKEAM